jgi:hypothetical protein
MAAAGRENLERAHRPLIIRRACSSLSAYMFKYVITYLATATYGSDGPSVPPDSSPEARSDAAATALSKLVTDLVVLVAAAKHRCLLVDIITALGGPRL